MSEILIIKSTIGFFLLKLKNKKINRWKLERVKKSVIVYLFVRDKVYHEGTVHLAQWRWGNEWEAVDRFTAGSQPMCFLFLQHVCFYLGVALLLYNCGTLLHTCIFYMTFFYLQFYLLTYLMTDLSLYFSKKIYFLSTRLELSIF